MMKPDYARIIPLITSKVSSKPKRVNSMKSHATTDFCTIDFASARDLPTRSKDSVTYRKPSRFVETSDLKSSTV